MMERYEDLIYYLTNDIGGCLISVGVALLASVITLFIWELTNKIYKVKMASFMITPMVKMI